MNDGDYSDFSAKIRLYGHSKYRITDITAPLSEAISPYLDPSIPYARIETLKTLERDGSLVHKITLSSLSGSYLETGAHLFPGKRMLDEREVDEFIRKALIVDVSPKGPGEHITAQELEYTCCDGLQGINTLLVYTGWESIWGQEGFYLNSPHFTMEAIEWVVSRQISLLGADIPSYDDPGNRVGLLRFFFEKTDGMILAPLVNLGTVKSRIVTLIALPLKVPGVCGAPCRAVVLEEA